MNVGIQEVEHVENLYTLIRLFDTGHNRVFLFVPRTTYLQIEQILHGEMCRYHWILHEEGDSTWAYCNRILRTVQQEEISLLYLNTISKHHLFFAFLVFRLSCKVILTVHDVNCLFRPTFSLRPRLLIQYIGKKALTGVVKEFNTISMTVEPALHLAAGANKKVWVIPGGLFEETTAEEAVTAFSSMDIIHIVVPGTLDAKRRNYEAVFELLNQVKKMPIKMTLLGGGSDEVADLIRNHASEFSNQLVFYKEATVPQAEFDKVMKQAHLIWMPLAIHTRICGSIPEIYGKTKSSGIIFDIVRYARPFLYPAELSIPDLLKSSGIGYSSLDELKVILADLVQKPEILLKLLQLAKENSTHFTIDKIRQANYPLFETMDSI
ncbi:glycosyltransferase family protein [Flavihumibacter cheonanensis]|uniref:hypothetical protein n=1 Tax=Flavihumibacter cheonanensis TaxID=1442385 RepID=UPI001EF8F5A2|nr:hypothetical protein [Flavihumibacter cheonanensis]MCG7751548.1 hypothetical protein [Flavihumibacter cheonanensis]